MIMNGRIKSGLVILNALLILAIIIGQYELLEPKTVIDIFVIPAFIISTSLFLFSKKSAKEKG